MATYKSVQIYDNYRARPIMDGVLHCTPAFKYLVPSGTLLANGDIIRLGRIDPSKVVVTRVAVDISGNLDGHATPASRTLAGTLGILRSANRAGTNISFTAAAGSTTAMTEDPDMFLAAGTAPLVTTNVATFGTAGATGQLSTGGVAVYNSLAAAQDSRGYDGAPVADVAISFTANSSTATTADIVIAVTLEFLAVAGTPSSIVPYLYADRYNSSGVSSI